MRNIILFAIGGGLLAFGLTSCDGGSDGSGSSSSSGFTSLFSTTLNSEPASINANSAGAVDPNAEPHSI